MSEETKRAGASLKEEGGKWLERIIASTKREADWHKDAESAENAYSVNDREASGDIPDFNILHSNVETIVPAIYNSTPVPDIRPRWPQKAQPVMMEGQPPQEKPSDPYQDVSDLIERAITVQIDDSSLDVEVEGAAQDGFLAGRGLVRIRITADENETTIDRIAGDNETEEQIELTVSNERVKFEVVPWRDYREGSARRFGDIPWVAYKHYVTAEDMENFDGDMIASQATAENAPTLANEGDTSDVPVWEIWDKATLKVKFVRESDGVILREQDDPLGLTGFFPSPKPIQPIGLTGKRTPIVPYSVYKKQALELDAVTKRIKAITSGLKVRGAIAGDAENIQKVADAGDNELVAIENVEGLAQTGGLDKAIIWWPVDKAIAVLRELYIARDQIKQLIYEITGISDIVRGASKSGETLGAQQIKTQWGSLRIKKMQRQVERHVRDLFVLSSEAIANNFTLTTLGEITGMEITQEMAQILEDGLRQYNINIESDSTVRADLTRMKGEMSEFLNGTASFFGTMQPLVQQAPEMAKPVIDLYSSFARQFSLGREAELAVEKMGEIAEQAATNPKPNPEAEKAKAEMSAKAQEMQARGQEAKAKNMLEIEGLKLKSESMKADLQLKAEQLKQTERGKQFDASIKAADMEIKRADLELRKVDRDIKRAELSFAKDKAVVELAIEQDQRRAAKIGD